MTRRTKSRSTSESFQAVSKQQTFPGPATQPGTFNLADWGWEVAAAATSLASFVVIVVVLRVYQDKPLSNWQFVVDISLNTLVAAEKDDQHS